MAASVEHCSICKCDLHRTAGTYARPSVLGRSHATKHHFVAERFFGRSANRKGKIAERLFELCPWGQEGLGGIFCYECHEELLHNPVILPEDIQKLSNLVALRSLGEQDKPQTREFIAGRIQLFQEVIARGIEELLREAIEKEEQELAKDYQFGLKQK